MFSSPQRTLLIVVIKGYFINLSFTLKEEHTVFPQVDFPRCGGYGQHARET